MDDIIKYIGQVAAEMVAANESKSKVVGVASEESAAEIERIVAEGAALKKTITDDVMEYTRQRMANARREVDVYMAHTTEKHEPQIAALERQQNAAWDDIRALFNIPAEIPDDNITMDRETREVIVRTPKEPANG